jgi:hypothetical protein
VQAGEDDAVLDQHSLLPSVTHDPKLWMVKCIAGGEREIVAQLMSKYVALEQQDRPLAIFSAFCHDLPNSAPLLSHIFIGHHSASCSLRSQQTVQTNLFFTGRTREMCNRCATPPKHVFDALRLCLPLSTPPPLYL